MDLPDDDDDPEGLRLFRKTPRGFVPVVQKSDDDAAKSSKKAKTASAAKPEESVSVEGHDMRLPASVFASGKETKAGLVNKGC